jgi:hypothetical protein
MVVRRRSAHPQQNKKHKKLSLNEMHEAIHRAIDQSLTDVESTSSRTATTSSSSIDMDMMDIDIDDAVQAIETIARPESSQDIENLGMTLMNAVLAAGDDPQKWKILALAIVHRRYHSKAPEAQSIKKTNKERSTKSSGDVNINANDNADAEIGSGHGERLSFYLMFVFFHAIAHGHHEKMKKVCRDYARKACESLARLALPAGGTRDVCALIEHVLFEEMERAGFFRHQKEKKSVGQAQVQDKKKGKTKRALCQAVVDFLVLKSDQDDAAEVKMSSTLSELLETAAHLVDKDLNLISIATNKDKSAIVAGVGVGVPSENANKKQKVCLMVSEEGEFQSTINTFIPHHNRGTNSRKLVQTVAELVIWSKTLAMKADAKFSNALSDLCATAGTGTENDDKIVKLVHTLQTSIRRKRQKLNASSREQGFSLCTSFEMDPTSITLEMIKSAKHGDVTKLQLIAAKARNITVTGLIANRFSDPSKAIPASCILALKHSWIRIARDKDDVDDDAAGITPRVVDDELTTLRIQMQEATVKATIDALRKKIPNKNGSFQKGRGRTIVASLDSKAAIDGAAILVAAALHHEFTNEDEDPTSITSTSNICNLEDEHKSIGTSSTLYLGSEEIRISSFSEVMTLLDRAFNETNPSNTSHASSPDLATTKNIQNLIDRHLQPNDRLLLFTASDVKLEQRVLKKLQDQNSMIHCHIIDEFSIRMEREKAKVGDITVTLAWDNHCDLDLSAKCPNGDLISYSAKFGGTEKGGGYLDVDMNVSGDSTEPVENIFFGDAEKGISADHGHYKIVVRNYAYHGNLVKDGEPVPWRVRVDKGGEITEYTGECKGSGPDSDVTVVEFDYEGRSKPVLEEVGSALSSSNLVSVTSSMGQSMDSISELMSLDAQYMQMEQVRNLVENDEGCGESMEAVQPEDSPATTQARSLMADRKTFNITNRERMYLNISKLPDSFHLEINRSFDGGATLQSHAASILAKHLIEDGVHVDELKSAGYQDDLIELVRKKMATFGIV